METPSGATTKPTGGETPTEKMPNEPTETGPTSGELPASGEASAPVEGYFERVEELEHDVKALVKAFEGRTGLDKAVLPAVRKAEGIVDRLTRFMKNPRLQRAVEIIEEVPPVKWTVRGVEQIETIPAAVIAELESLGVRGLAAAARALVGETNAVARYLAGLAESVEGTEGVYGLAKALVKGAKCVESVEKSLEKFEGEAEGHEAGGEETEHAGGGETSDGHEDSGE